MKAHFGYLRYVLRHKWFVFLGCLKTGAPLWRAIIHDLSKFTPAEWGAYVERFYGGRNSQLSKDNDTFAFHLAWRHHWTHNPHHWEYWAIFDADDQQPKPMPEHFVREMVADWYGAGMAQGKHNIAGWYAKNKHRMVLHPDTAKRVDVLLLKVTPSLHEPLSPSIPWEDDPNRHAGE